MRRALAGALALVFAFAAGVGAGIGAARAYDRNAMMTTAATTERERARLDVCLAGWSASNTTTRTISERADRWAELVDNLPPCLEQAPHSRVAHRFDAGRTEHLE